MTRAAVIDVGTNSVKLTIADLDRDITIVREESQITRLGKSVDSDGLLSSDAIQKTFDVIVSFNTSARECGCESIVAAGTSALRDAKNGDVLISAVKDKCRLDIEIITGIREASLAYAAVFGDPHIISDKNSNTLVFDIGGGSTELIWGMGAEIKDNVSLNIGALRLTERHFHSDPPTEEEFRDATADGVNLLRSFIAGKSLVDNVCGVGGTAVTLASIVHSTKNVHGLSVSLDRLDGVIKHLMSLKLDQRRKVEFLEPERADIIIAGGAILLSLLRELNAQSFRVSVRGMRYGLLLEQKAMIDQKLRKC